MRRTVARIALLAALLAPAATALAQRDGEQMKVLPQAALDVVKVLLAQERAWNAGDIATFAGYYKDSPDIIFIGGEEAKGFDDLLSGYKKKYPDHATMGQLTYSDLDPRVLDDHYAIVTGSFRLERDKKHGGILSGVFSLVLEKEPAGWRIILDHTS